MSLYGIINFGYFTTDNSEVLHKSISLVYFMFCLVVIILV